MNKLCSENAEFRLDSYDFPFSEEWIAERPAEPRDSSRLLVLDRRDGALRHGRFRDLPEFLRPGDCLVLNRTKVRPARLEGRKSTGGKVEMLLVRELEPGLWTALSSDIKAGARVEFEAGVHAAVERLNSEGEWECRFSDANVTEFMARRGLAPLPPYILKKRKRAVGAPDPRADLQSYQTVFAREEGSIAAPTAGLHFTTRLLDELRSRGVRVAEITLHVGHGTFKPISAADIREHRMKREWYSVSPSAAETLAETRRAGGRIVAVGTTAVRTLETYAQSGSREDWTDIFIRPGHSFRLVDSLVTNFHLPQSTPLVLACAFAGKEPLLAAYREAAAGGYRFYSFGDAMLIL